MWIGFVIAIFIQTGESKKLEEQSFIPFITGQLIEPLNLIFRNACLGDLGCFYNGPPFYHPIYRPLSLLPDYQFYTKYYAFTRENVNDSYRLNLTEESIANSPLKSDLPLKVLIHGYNVELHSTDVRYLMKTALLEYGDYNIIIVDWTEHNSFPYPQAVANARVVGAQCAKLIKLCKKVKGISIERTHIIGHSLGAHIAGWAGDRLKEERLGRISGLDPAGPYFHNAPPEVRLDSADAMFVDVIHTNAASNFIQGLGLEETIGDLDFYPNGGNHQTGCISNADLEDILTETFDYLIVSSCDHSRANFLYLESINVCTFLAVQCPTYRAFKRGKCTNETSRISVMGYEAEPLIGLPKEARFYLNTYANPPYCIVNSTFIVD